MHTTCYRILPRNNYYHAIPTTSQYLLPANAHMRTTQTASHYHKKQITLYADSFLPLRYFTVELKKQRYVE